MVKMDAPTTGEKPIMEPYYGFNGKSQPRQLICNLGLTASAFIGQYAPSGHRSGPVFRSLRNPADAPKPANAYEVLELTGGRQRFYQTIGHTGKHAPWFYRLVNGERDCYVVWGRKGKDGAKVFGPGQTRTSSGRGVIYTRYPGYRDDGRLACYCYEFIKIEFAVLNRQPERGERLRIQVERYCSSVESGKETKEHGLYLGFESDDLWQTLAQQAKAGFEAHCTDRLDPEIEQWRQWFLEQRAAAADGMQTERFRADCRRGDWFAGLNCVTQAWQLAIALEEWRYLFQVEQDASRKTREGTYEVTLDIMQEHLVGAYLERCSEQRKVELGRWMSDYVRLTSRLYNYTGD